MLQTGLHAIWEKSMFEKGRNPTDSRTQAVTEVTEKSYNQRHLISPSHPSLTCNLPQNPIMSHTQESGDIFCYYSQYWGWSC